MVSLVYAWQFTKVRQRMTRKRVISIQCYSVLFLLQCLTNNYTETWKFIIVKLSSNYFSVRCWKKTRLAIIKFIYMKIYKISYKIVIKFLQKKQKEWNLRKLKLKKYGKLQNFVHIKFLQWFHWFTRDNLPKSDKEWQENVLFLLQCLENNYTET